MRKNTAQRQVAQKVLFQPGLSQKVQGAAGTQTWACHRQWCQSKGSTMQDEHSLSWLQTTATKALTEISEVHSAWGRASRQKSR